MNERIYFEHNGNMIKGTAIEIMKKITCEDDYFLVRVDHDCTMYSDDYCFCRVCDAKQLIEFPELPI